MCSEVCLMTPPHDLRVVLVDPDMFRSEDWRIGEQVRDCLSYT